jgi:hypothetical protein
LEKISFRELFGILGLIKSRIKNGSRLVFPLTEREKEIFKALNCPLPEEG